MYEPKNGPNLSHHGEPGFTLLEVMIAAGIILVGLVAVMNSVVSTNSLRASADDRTVVRARLATVIDELRRASGDELRNYTPPSFTDRSPAIEIEVEYVMNEERDRLSPPINDEDIEIPNPVEVHITSTATFTAGRTVTTHTAAILLR
jgi:prepilin-type N-terminal cleavage/methylation domain-containing protein